MEKLFFPLILAVILALVIIVQVKGKAAFDPCQSVFHKLLPTDSFQGNTDRTLACGYYGLNAAWYRFSGIKAALPQSCPPKKRCGAFNPGWLNGTYPTLEEGVVTREICYRWSSNCCNWRRNIKVKNCKGFYVYKLQRPPSCGLRYCGLPGRTPLPTVNSTSTTSIIIQWNAPDEVGDGIRGYKVRWQEKVTSIAKQKVITGNRMAIIDSLTPYTWYDIRVQAYNKEGNGPWSLVLGVRTNESQQSTGIACGSKTSKHYRKTIQSTPGFVMSCKETAGRRRTKSEGDRACVVVPSVAPGNFKLDSSSSLSLDVSWDAIPVNQHQGILLGYIIFYTKNGSQVSQSKKVGPNQFMYKIEGLEFARYSVKVAGFTAVGNGKFTDPLSRFPNEGGTASRKCSAEGILNEANVTDCSSEVFNELKDVMEAIIKGEQSDLSAQQVLSLLANASQPVNDNSLRPPEIYKRDLIIGVNILVKLAEYNSKTSNVSSIDDFKLFAQVASNLLESRNKETWKELDKEGQGRSVILVKAMDDYGLGVAATLNLSTVPRVVERKNLKMRIDIVGQKSRTRGLKVAYNQSSIYLPPPVFRSPQDTRVVTVIYLTLHEVLSLPREDKDEGHQTVSANTTIVSSTVFPRPPDVLSSPVKIVLRNQKTQRKPNLPVDGKCVFWRPDEVARWSTSGCRLVPSESNASLTTCECDHLTIFAALMDPYGTSPPSKPLEIISIVGCSISLIAVVITISMYLISWKTIKRSGGRVGVKVLLHLCTALAVSYALVIFEGSARNKTWCLAVAVLLHYSLLALFSWMLCEGVLHYLVVVKLVPGDEADEKFKYFCIFGWGFPAIVVAISLGVTQTNGYGDSVCWLDVKTGLIWAFIAPALLVILINIVVYVTVLRCMLGSSEAQKMRNTGKERSRVKASIVLLPLFGIAWLFGLMSFSSETILFKYLFAILNSLQGLMIFVLHCARNKILRDAVKRQFKKCSISHANLRLNITPNNTKATPREKQAIKQHSRNEDCDHELEQETTESRSGALLLNTMLRQEDENNGNEGEDREEHLQPLSDG